jgi:hypothetical protein
MNKMWRQRRKRKWKRKRKSRRWKKRSGKSNECDT